MNRRNVLIGLGGVVAGGGALIGTGAFTTVEAQRDVTVETAGDADAFLGLEPARGPDALDLDGDDFAEVTGGTLEISIGEGDNGLNQNAITTFNHLVLVTNNGTQEVAELALEFTETPGDVDADETFAFPVANTDGTDITDGPETLDHVTDGINILTGANGIPGTLGAGEAVVFGLEIDLLNGGNDDNDLPTDGEYTLTIEANTA